MHTALLGSEPPVVIVPPAELSDARDRDLLRQISDGDQEAFRRLFRQYAPTAQSLARRIVIQQFLAEEILQEAFLAVWKRPEAFDSERGSVRAWLMSLVHHRAVDAVRREEAQRRRAKEAVLDQPVVEEDPAATVVEELGLPGERAAVRAALSEIPEEQRRVIELMYFGGLSQSKIAEQLELPLGTVKSRTLLGMRRLRGALLGMER
ncbi:MAG: sigma-70 family RNA polymerase sigma factor [Actinomycetota bacterium]